MPEKYHPTVNEVLARIYPDKNARRWKVSFDDHGVSFCRGDHDRYEECDWEELPNHILNQIGDQLKAELAHEWQGLSRY